MRFVEPELVENDTFKVLITHVAREKSHLCIYLNMALEATIWLPSLI